MIQTVKNLRDEVMPAFRLIWETWASTLPEDTSTSWRRGAAYIRESSIKSVMTGAQESQLRNTLALLASKRVYVPWEGIFFDNASGTDIGPRTAFQRLFEEALAGHFEVVGAFMPERLFRNAAQARQIKDRFRIAGIELTYVGKFEGDQRDPYAWQNEAMQDVNAEMMARQTGYQIGRTLESMSASGHPLGRLPEAYAVSERAPAFLGRQGRVLSWCLVEPLASIIREAKDRYLAGASYADLARWSLGTEVAGQTPAGSVMNAWWWRATLHNPKFAGLQMPTEYQGFQPGTGPTKKRPRRTRESALVPCKLPALWSADDYYAILDIGVQRSGSAKARRTYRSYLLSGVAVDSTCGHGMSVHSKAEEGLFWMICRKLDAEGRHSSVLRADLAEGELDALLAKISLSSPDLRRQVEEELRVLAAMEAGQRERFEPDPKIASMRQAISALSDAGATDMRADAERRIAELEAADVARRDSLAIPVLEFRKAAAMLTEWEAVWADADINLKNKLLRSAGVRALIGPISGDPDGHGHLLSIAAENPMLELALATALSQHGLALTFEGSNPLGRSNVHTGIHLETRLAGIAERLLPGLRIVSDASRGEDRMRKQRRPISIRSVWSEATAAA